MKTYSLDQLFRTRWEDLSQKQFAKVIDLSDMINSLDISTVQYGHACIEMLRTLNKRKFVVSNIELDQAIDCFNAIKFFQRDSKGNFRTPWYFFPELKMRLLRRPEIIGGLPMYNRTFDQLIYADAAYSNFCLQHYEYKRSPNVKLIQEMENSVNEIAAVLYTAPERFDPVKTEEIARKISASIPVQTRAIILHTYANVRSFIINRCPNLFPQPTDEDSEEGDDIPVHTGPMWMNMRYDLAETEVFKGLETARRSLIYDTMDFLEKKAFENTQRKTNA